MLNLGKIKEAITTRGKWVGDIKLWNISDWAVEFGEEAGEVLGVVKRMNRKRVGYKNAAKLTDAELKEKLKEEVGDAVLSLMMVCIAADVDMEEAIVEKFNKTSVKIGAPHRVDAKGKIFLHA